ncbi:hypothetical protein AGE29_03680 [Clostridium botulinum]|uniref:Uncharacterized protein n=2 Tax=Clostridium botulinum TaxID=1491 RepID=A0A846I377_CLOBO|nr:hypothetical protein [Clostridium botulinum]ACQ53766.1 hypothetical protein CLJ_B2102 [Clostridium botulinum Ba4 str. 657]AJE10149.1 hypothetical protein T259_2519 [Clostridium botulinum CDC_1436]AUN01503.1 hypothetical protein RSJ19_00530 [Clostridium botulinum]AUN03382.1 hypothetical protein RSJ19_10810 [Clostridium botulinum]AXG90913.1 hypothetical protein AGE29_03680 [Clostridium botulinum]
MDTVTLLINLISMIATVISCIIAVRAKNETQKIWTNIKNQEFKDSSVKNEGNIRIENSGDNKGTMSGIITGGVNKNAE